jgi:Phosphotransferase enzyme family
MTAAVGELETRLEEVLGGRSLRIVVQEQLKTDVHRLLVDIDGRERLLVVKRSDPAVARRGWLVARRWLPAVDLEGLGPPLLGLAADTDGGGTWQVYEDLPGRPLSTDPPVDGEVEVAIDAIARVHTAFAEHRLLRECRLWGGDRGIYFYSANLRDAVIALGSLELDSRGAEAIDARDALLDRIGELQEEEPERAQILRAVGGPETLLHGDLWPSNAIVISNGDGTSVRLIDWDEAGAGPIWFDLSTFLLRFDSSRRGWILNAYGRAIDRLAGWLVPPEHELNVILETAAYSRLASLLVWSVAAADESESEWLLERLTAMCEWLDAVKPVLPAR